MGSVLLDFVIVFNMRRVYSKNMNEDDSTKPLYSTHIEFLFI